MVRALAFVVVALAAFPSILVSQNACGTGSAWFAASVAGYSPGPGVTPGQGFGVPDLIRCVPGGFSHVVSLGVGGTVTVGFDAPLVDGPGTDFVTWENGFVFGGLVYGELAFVEVSTDGLVFARFPSRYFGPAGPLGPFDGLPAGCVRNLAGLGTLTIPASFGAYADPTAAGGDAFDLEDLQGHPLVLSGAVDLGAIHFVRLRDILGDGSTFDALGAPIFDPVSTTSSSDWDAVAVVHNALNQAPGRPRVAVSFDEGTRQLSLSVADSDGLGTVDWASLRATFNESAFDLQAFLPLFPSVSFGPDSLSITSVPIPGGAYGSLALAVADFGGSRGADVGVITP